MPFIIDVDTSGPVNRIGGMIRAITIFGSRGIRREMDGWQTDDMHREKAWSKKIPWRAHRAGAWTLIRPHSKHEVERSAAYQKGARRRARAAARRKRPVIIAIAHPKTSTRPILRAVLIDKLGARLQEALGRAITWSSPIVKAGDNRNKKK
jgi:hypothetical protein